MGYNYKIIDKRRQESPFLILEKNIYKNLNVGTLAKITDTYSGGCKLITIPRGEYIYSNYSVVQDSYNIGDLVTVLFLDNYGTEPLNDKTVNIMHDYKNAVILGKVYSPGQEPAKTVELYEHIVRLVGTNSGATYGVAYIKIINNSPEKFNWTSLLEFLPTDKDSAYPVDAITGSGVRYYAFYCPRGDYANMEGVKGSKANGTLDTDLAWGFTSYNTVTDTVRKIL